MRDPLRERQPGAAARARSHNTSGAALILQVDAVVAIGLEIVMRVKRMNGIAGLPGVGERRGLRLGRRRLTRHQRGEGERRDHGRTVVPVDTA